SLYLIGCVFEIAGILSKAVDYVHIYNIDERALHWQFLSINHFLFWHSIKALLCAAYILLVIRIFKNYNVIVFRLLVAITIILMILIARYGILWIESGYDHYPGFDPFLL